MTPGRGAFTFRRVFSRPPEGGFERQECMVQYHGNFQLSKVFDYWETGARELEKTGVGKVVTAPVRIAQTTAESVQKLIKDVPDVAIKTTKTIPFILILLAAGVTGYMVFMGKKGKRIV